jgi:hypothetical protein
MRKLNPVFHNNKLGQVHWKADGVDDSHGHPDSDAGTDRRQCGEVRPNMRILSGDDLVAEQWFLVSMTFCAIGSLTMKARIEKMTARPSAP